MKRMNLIAILALSACAAFMPMNSGLYAADEPAVKDQPRMEKGDRDTYRDRNFRGDRDYNRGDRNFYNRDSYRGDRGYYRDSYGCSDCGSYSSGCCGDSYYDGGYNRGGYYGDWGCC